MNFFVKVFCVSLVYCGTLLSYPIQDNTDSISEFPDKFRVSEKVTKYEIAKSPQMTRLLDIYYDLVQLDDLFRDGNDVDGKKTYRVKDKDYLAKGNSVGHTYGADARGMRSYTNSIDNQRSKRQQGWYIQYGKRNIGTSFFEQDVGFHRTNSNGGHYEDNRHVDMELELKNKISTSRFAQYKIAELDDSEGLNGKNELNFKNLYKRDQGDVSETHDRLGNFQREQRPGISKRQQGWFISYGKRNGNGLQLYFL